MRRFSIYVILFFLGIGCAVSENMALAQKNIQLNISSCKLKVGKSKKLIIIAGRKPKEKLKWKSADKKIASVNQNGLVKAKKAGSTLITVKVGNRKATCKVTVQKKKEDLKDTSLSTPPPVDCEEGAGWYTGRVLSIASSGNPKYIGMIGVSTDGSDKIQAYVMLTEEVLYMRGNDYYSLSCLNIGDWINFNSEKSDNAFPSTIYGCSHVKIL